MPEIEFVETQPPTHPEQTANTSQRPLRATLIGLIPAAFALAGAVLATWAPFLSIYTISEPRGGISDISTDPSGNSHPQTVEVSFDGWGRLHTSDASGAFTVGHGVRYGIVLGATAGAFILSAGAIAGTVTMLGRTSWARRLLASGHVLAVAAIGGAAAMSATSYLAFLQARDDIASEQSANFGGPTNIHVANGGCWLLAGAAAVAGLLAVGSRLLIARLARGDDDVDRYVSQTPPSLSAYGGGNFPGGDAL